MGRPQRAGRATPVDGLFTVNLFIVITVDRTDDGDRHVIVRGRSHRRVLKAHALEFAMNSK